MSTAENPTPSPEPAEGTPPEARAAEEIAPQAPPSEAPTAEKHGNEGAAPAQPVAEPAVFQQQEPTGGGQEAFRAQQEAARAQREYARARSEQARTDAGFARAEAQQARARAKLAAAQRRTGPRTGPIVWGALILAFCAYVAQRTLAPGSVDSTVWITLTVLGLGVLLLLVGLALLLRRGRNDDATDRPEGSRASAP